MSSQTIAVVEATGNQGGSVLKTFASSRKYKVRALTRNPQSNIAIELKSNYPDVEWIKADPNDASSLRKAFSRAHAVFGVTQTADPDILSKVSVGNTDAEFDQGKNIIDAAIAEKVDVVIMSTLPSIAEASKGKYTKALHYEGKHKIAQYLDSKKDQISGVNIYLGAFMENFINFSRLDSKDNETVEFAYPLKPTTLLPLVDTANDTGPVVMYALEHADEYQGQPILVSGGMYKAQVMVKTFIDVTGKPARYVQIPYQSVGMEGLCQMFQFIDEFGQYEDFDFEGQNKKINHHFTTPVEFWKQRGWTGPSSK